jgi:hypothetical protein
MSRRRGAGDKRTHKVSLGVGNEATPSLLASLFAVPSCPLSIAVQPGEGQNAPLSPVLIKAHTTPSFDNPTQVTMKSGRLVMNSATWSPALKRRSDAAQFACKREREMGGGMEGGRERARKGGGEEVQEAKKAAWTRTTRFARSSNCEKVYAWSRKIMATLPGNLWTARSHRSAAVICASIQGRILQLGRHLVAERNGGRAHRHCNAPITHFDCRTQQLYIVCNSKVHDGANVVMGWSQVSRIPENQAGAP